MTQREPRGYVIEISDDTLVCPDCGKPVYRVWETVGRERRPRDFCPRDGFDLGYDAAVTRAQWLLSAQAARLATQEAAA